MEAAKHETSFESRCLLRRRPSFLGALAAGNARFKYPLSEWKSQARQKIQDSPSKYCIQKEESLHALISVRLDRCEQEAITGVIPGGKRFSPTILHHSHKILLRIVERWTLSLCFGAANDVGLVAAANAAGLNDPISRRRRFLLRRAEVADTARCVPAEDGVGERRRLGT